MRGLRSSNDVDGGTQRRVKRFWLFESRVVPQRPAVAGARGLGNPQGRRQVVPAPDKRGRDGDPREIRGWDRRHPNIAHEDVESGVHGRRARTIEVVRLEQLPTLTHLLA